RQNSRRFEILVTNLWTGILLGRWRGRKCLRDSADGAEIRIDRGCCRHVISDVHRKCPGTKLGDIHECGLVRETWTLNGRSHQRAAAIRSLMNVDVVLIRAVLPVQSNLNAFVRCNPVVLRAKYS